MQDELRPRSPTRSPAGYVLRSTPGTAADLAAYATVPIAFTAHHRWDGSPIDPPLTKDYDALPGHHPTDWAARFDLTRWRFAAAFNGDRRVGGAAVVVDPAGLDLVDDPHTAVLWDLRVHPGHRRRGVGRLLLGWAETTARAAGRQWLTIETQNVNPVACRFYAAHGYAVVAIDPAAYPDLPGETQVLWAKLLG